MTEKEEAIIILDGFKDNPLFNEQHKKALDMAIKALSENKRDLISRGEVESVLHNNLHALIDTDELYQLYKDINHLTTYSFPDSADIEKIRAEIAEIPNKYPMTADYENGIREALSIIDKHIGGKDK